MMVTCDDVTVVDEGVVGVGDLMDVRGEKSIEAHPEGTGLAV